MSREMSPLPQASSEAEAAKPIQKPKGKIEVRALRAGFIYNHRKFEGDVFQVDSMEKVGTWMECTDPKMEKLHQEMMKEKKKLAGG